MTDLKHLAEEIAHSTKYEHNPEAIREALERVQKESLAARIDFGECIHHGQRETGYYEAKRDLWPEQNMRDATFEMRGWERACKWIQDNIRLAPEKKPFEWDAESYGKYLKACEAALKKPDIAPVEQVSPESIPCQGGKCGDTEAGFYQCPAHWGIYQMRAAEKKARE